MKRIVYQFIEFMAKCLRGRACLRSAVYDPLKVVFRNRLCSLDYMLYYMSSNRQYGEVFPDAYDAPDETKRLGVIKDPFGGHEPYAAACKGMKVGYRMVDIFSHDWINQVKHSKCKVFLVWPGESIQEWKRLYDDRIRFIVEYMGKKVFPDLPATWIYGSKERQSAWMDLNAIPHPLTKIFYKKDEALEYVYSQTAYPIIAKTDMGAVASGVRILRSCKEAAKYVNAAFSTGIQGYYSDKQTRQWRHVLFQEYLPNTKEWRVHRQGDSFFGFGKIKKGDFHSGSGGTHWVAPPTAALDLAWSITERGGFKSMAVDIFETEDGRFLVNELQCVYGQHCAVQLVKDGVSGRFLRREGGQWEFEAGEFSINHGCNLRVEAALKLL